MRFSAFMVELARDSDRTFNLSTCLLYVKTALVVKSFTDPREHKINWLIPHKKLIYKENFISKLEIGTTNKKFKYIWLITYAKETL